jgi:hypothetical protein
MLNILTLSSILAGSSCPHEKSIFHLKLTMVSLNWVWVSSYFFSFYQEQKFMKRKRDLTQVTIYKAWKKLEIHTSLQIMMGICGEQKWHLAKADTAPNRWHGVLQSYNACIYVCSGKEISGWDATTMGIWCRPPLGYRVPWISTLVMSVVNWLSELSIGANHCLPLDLGLCLRFTGWCVRQPLRSLLVEIEDVLHNIISRCLLEWDLMQKLPRAEH